MLRFLSTPFRNIAVTNKIVKITSQSVCTTPRLLLKEIRQSQEGDTLVFEGVNVPSPRENLIVRSDNEHGACSLCTLGLDVKHTDVLIIKQFMDPKGKLFPRRITGLCRWQQRKMEYLIEMATRAGLINSLLPPDYKIPEYQRGWRPFNSYYIESEIPPSKSEYSLKKKREFEEAYRIAKAEKDAHEEMLRKRRELRRLEVPSIPHLK